MTPAQQQRIIDTIDKLVGGMFTSEVAAALIYAIQNPPDESIDPFRFQAEVHGEYVFQVEPFAALITELHPLHEAQWRETEMHRHGLPFNPDYEAGKALERAGTLIQFTARRHDELVGHMRMYLQRSVHTQTLFAHEDTVFVVPEHRGGLLGLALVRYAEKQLRGLGVREVRFDTKHSNKADAILRRLRYEPVATRWSKIILSEE